MSHGINNKMMEAIIRSVKHVDIRGNKLKTLPQTVVNVNATSKLWISNNPYECSCDMIWMKDWLTNAENVKDKHNVKCYGYKMKGRDRKI